MTDNRGGNNGWIEGADWRHQPDRRGSPTLSRVYEEVFGVPAQHQDDETTMFRFNGTYFFLHRDAAHHDAVSDDVLRLAQSGVGQFVTFVDDADAVRAQLDQLGVSVIDGPADRPWGMRTMTFADPGGYTWEITQRLEEGQD